MAECSCQIVRCCPRSRRRQRGTPCRRKIPPDKTRWDLLRIETVVSPRRAFGGDPSETRFRVAMPSTWTVGRGAHTPPNQAAGITGPAVGIAGQFGRIYNPPLQAYPLPFSVVGAACMAARTAPAGPPGLRAWQPAPGGMWACRPTAFDGGAAGIGGLFGRLIAAPTGAPAAVSRRRGGYQPPGPHRRDRNGRAASCSTPVVATGPSRRSPGSRLRAAGRRRRGAWPRRGG